MFANKGEMAPLLSNIYLHYALDGWFEAYNHSEILRCGLSTLGNTSGISLTFPDLILTHILTDVMPANAGIP